MTPSPALQTIMDDMAFLPDWEARYEYLIDLGKRLPPMDSSLKTPQTAVPGCTSHVWLLAERQGDVIYFHTDSDAVIVKGLLAILMAAYNNQTPEHILNLPIEDTFTQMQLVEHLSPNRRNGFTAMVQRIRQEAAN
jgi:cysteine desulfuration protein SufE